MTAVIHDEKEMQNRVESRGTSGAADEPVNERRADETRGRGVTPHTASPHALCGVVESRANCMRVCGLGSAHRLYLLVIADTQTNDTVVSSATFAPYP